MKGTGYGQLGRTEWNRHRPGWQHLHSRRSNHRVLKLAPDGTLIDEWKGPDPGFYGPRRIAIAPDNSIYVVDQGAPDR